MMRAKMIVASVTRYSTTSEVVNFHAVAASKYPEDGSDENNTYAKFSPSANCAITIANPELLGKFNPGDTFYVDFIAVPTLAPAESAPPTEA